MTGSIKTYTFFIFVLALLTVTTFSLPASEPVSGSAAVFARCEACHPDNADTTKTSPHYQMKCTDCHQISSFQENTHNATKTSCSGCHEGIGTRKQHTKSRYFPESDFVFSLNITETDKATYISFFQPVNGSI
ncbi:MAG: hypothetical protein WC568_06375 [Candidatus Methanoperedens sp.]